MIKHFIFFMQKLKHSELHLICLTFSCFYHHYSILLEGVSLDTNSFEYRSNNFFEMIFEFMSLFVTKEGKFILILHKEGMKIHNLQNVQVMTECFAY